MFTNINELADAIVDIVSNRNVFPKDQLNEFVGRLNFYKNISSLLIFPNVIEVMYRYCMYQVSISGNADARILIEQCFAEYSSQRQLCVA